MTSWKCSNCGYSYDAEKPYEKCPSCDKVCEFVDATNYVPKMDRNGRECKCEVCGTEIKVTNDCGGFLKCCDQIMVLK
jgi:rubredoxin